ncbi:MAG: hypothetical protein JEY99_09075 [Spirochaetales bacterium]|nr:hypothetical protein [Spirochaetales bacterium]
MNKLLFLPGILFLFVIFFRVILPLIKTPAWKRALNSARYERVQKNMEKSDRYLTLAVNKYPNEPAVYLEYYLNHSESQDLFSRFETLHKGWELTKDTALEFFIGSVYLEEGDFEKAAAILEKPEIVDYTSSRHIFIHPLLYMDMGDYDKALEEYWKFHGVNPANEAEIQAAISSQSAQDLLPLVMIQRSTGGPWLETMKNVPAKSMHSDMSWTDYEKQLKEQLKNLKPAKTGIFGSPERFNARRKKFYNERLDIVKEGIVKLTVEG